MQLKSKLNKKGGMILYKKNFLASHYQWNLLITATLETAHLA